MKGFKAKELFTINQLSVMHDLIFAYEDSDLGAM